MDNLDRYIEELNEYNNITEVMQRISKDLNKHLHPCVDKMFMDVHILNIDMIDEHMFRALGLKLTFSRLDNTKSKFDEIKIKC